jgi:hypothetical protein
MAAFRGICYFAFLTYLSAVIENSSNIVYLEPYVLCYVQSFFFIIGYFEGNMWKFELVFI